MATTACLPSATERTVLGATRAAESAPSAEGASWIAPELVTKR